MLSVMGDAGRETAVSPPSRAFCSLSQAETGHFFEGTRVAWSRAISLPSNDGVLQHRAEKSRQGSRVEKFGDGLSSMEEREGE